MATPVCGQADEPQWPDIKNPGLDLGDYPNSAYTIPACACQIEFTPFSIMAEDEYNQPAYFTQFLLRFGLTDDVEFRILGNGFTAVYTEPQMIGFSPIALDAKVHLWDAKREWLLPASSLEVILSTDWGTPAFCDGYQPSINLNFDLPITDTLTFECTVGYGEVVGLASQRSPQGGPLTTRENVNQVSFSWSFGQDLTEDLQVFVTGITLQSEPGESAGTTLACGGFWR